MEKEFDLVKILPEIQAIQLDKRSMIQIYALGESSVSCFFQGMTWEQPCTEVDSETDMTRLYHFAEMMKKRLVELSGVKDIPPTIYGDITDPNVPFSFSRGEYTFTMTTGGAQGGFYATLRKRGVPMWKSAILGTSSYPNEFQMNPIAGSGASGVIDVYIHDVTFFGRYLCDVDEVTIGSQTYHPAKLSSQDMVSDNRNFRRALGYQYAKTLWWVEPP